MRAGRPRSQVIRNSMRAGRPRSQEMPSHSPLEGDSQKPSRKAKADAVGGRRRAARLRRTATSGPFSTVRIS